jgi:hypothetical protein
MRRITIIAVHHKLQWKDSDAGNLESLLTKVLQSLITDLINLNLV